MPINKEKIISPIAHPYFSFPGLLLVSYFHFYPNGNPLQEVWIKYNSVPLNPWDSLCLPGAPLSAGVSDETLNVVRAYVRFFIITRRLINVMMKNLF